MVKYLTQGKFVVISFKICLQSSIILTFHTALFSYERNEPFSFQLGIGKVILGWEKGLMGTCKGDKLKLVVPPHMGYGDVSYSCLFYTLSLQV